MIELLWAPALAGIGIALLAGPYGSLLLWRRMAFFGDTLAHAALPGVAIALWLQVDITATVVCSSVLLVLLLLYLERRTHMPQDTVLAVLAHSALAFGLLGVALAGTRGPGLESFLIGDLLTVVAAELLWVVAAVVLLGALLISHWQRWLAIAVDEELARVEGLPVTRLRLLQLLATAVLIALAIRIVGVLLVAALLTVPAAGIRRLAKSPESMAVAAALLGSLAVVSGLAISWFWDTPSGPSIVVAASVFFFAAQLLPLRRHWPIQRGP